MRALITYRGKDNITKQKNIKSVTTLETMDCLYSVGLPSVQIKKKIQQSLSDN